MTKYRMMIDVEVSTRIVEIEIAIRETIEDWSGTVSNLKITKLGSPGRKPDRKTRSMVEVWIKRRTKPFTCATFAKYLGVSNNAAWKRLEGLVRAGVIIKERMNGEVIYRVEDPTERITIASTIS